MEPIHNFFLNLFQMNLYVLSIDRVQAYAVLIFCHCMQVNTLNFPITIVLSSCVPLTRSV